MVISFDEMWTYVGGEAVGETGGVVDLDSGGERGTAAGGWTLRWETGERRPF